MEFFKTLLFYTLKLHNSKTHNKKLTPSDYLTCWSIFVFNWHFKCPSYKFLQIGKFSIWRAQLTAILGHIDRGFQTLFLCLERSVFMGFENYFANIFQVFLVLDLTDRKPNFNIFRISMFLGQQHLHHHLYGWICLVPCGFVFGTVVDYVLWFHRKVQWFSWSPAGNWNFGRFFEVFWFRFYVTDFLNFFRFRFSDFQFLKVFIRGFVLFSALIFKYFFASKFWIFCFEFFWILFWKIFALFYALIF